MTPTLLFSAINMQQILIPPVQYVNIYLYFDIHSLEAAYNVI